jgi:hypothetical protein
MNCAEFEHGLTDLLAGETSADQRRTLAARLKEHADRCPECGPADDLLEWSSLEPADRFADRDPGPEYWADFERRLADRIREERPARSRATVWLAAAAAVLVVISVVWVLLPDGPEPSDVAVADTTPDPEEFRLPEPIEDRLRERAVEASVPFDGLAAPAGYEAVLEDALRLDARERTEFLKWLQDQTAEPEGDKA